MCPLNWVCCSVDRWCFENLNGFAAGKRDDGDRLRSGALVEVVTRYQFTIRRDRGRARILVGDLDRLAALDRNFPDAKSPRAKRCVDYPLTIRRNRRAKSRRISQQLRVTSIDVHSPYLRARAPVTEDNMVAIRGCGSKTFAIGIVSELFLVAPIGIHNPEIRIITSA